MEVKSTDKNTYGQALKSTALIGGSSVITIALSMVRTKAVALILDPAGVGLFGIFTSISELVQTVAGLGVRSSGVRQIAEAVATGDSGRVARTVTALRRVIWIAAAVATLLLVVFCRPVARSAFGDDLHAGSVALLALTVFFATVAGGETALIQGVRRIGDLARASVFGALGGTVATIAIIFFYGESGVVPSLVAVALIGLLGVWWYSRKVSPDRVPVTVAELRTEASDLVKLGFVFMASALMVAGVNYVIRIIILQKQGLAAAGLYQAAWTMGGLYVSTVLQAMGSDFFPRLTAVAHDNPKCNQLVNEQAEVSLFIAGPGILATLTFAPAVLEIFYSAKFGGAVEILRWFCLGMMLRVASWPMGFILHAKGARRAFFFSDLAASIVQLGLAWVCVSYFGLKGAGIAFFGSYLFYWIQIFAIVRAISGFSWSPEHKRIALLYVVLIAAVFMAPYLKLRIEIVVAGGGLITLLASIYSLRKICTLVPFERLPKLAQRLLTRLRLLPAQA